MAVYSKQFLSSSTNGRPILVSATSSSGTAIHTAHATSKDEVWVYAYNDHTSSVDVTVEYGGVTTTDVITQAIPGQSGLRMIIPGLILTNSQIVSAFASTGNKISISGYVNRIT